jgi:enediyne polyketide synthase
MRYADAVQQCERIYAVVRGWGVSSDGRGGLTRPESEGQQLALQRCYRRAGYGIESVGYFEGHGTGTTVGDATELDALLSARQASGEPVLPAVISSIKANIGHTKAAAGLAGLVRAVKCVAEPALPPATACGRPHRLLVEHADNLSASSIAREWPDQGLPRRAGISAMGFGGINTHVTIEEAPAERRPAVRPVDGEWFGRLGTVQDAELFLFAAPRLRDLRWIVDHVTGFAAECSRAELSDLAVELARRATLDMTKNWKAAVVASRPAELRQRLEQLEAVLDGADEETLHVSVSDGVFLSGGDRKGSVGLVFPGQGAPAPAAGGIHSRRFDEVRRTYERSNLTSFDDRGDTDFAHSAVITAAVAGLEMLRRVGAEGRLAIGHSLGELAALHWAGCFDLASLETLARVRGQTITSDERTRGAMAAVAADRDETARLVNGHQGVVVANINAPRQTIVAGDREAIDALVSRARHQGTAVTQLGVRRAFHSPAMAGAAVGLARAIGDLAFGPPQRTVISSVTGDVLDDEVEVVGYLADQLVQPVQFLAAVTKAAAEVDLFVEVGPGEVISTLVRRSVDTPAVSLDVGGASLDPYLRAVGACFVLGRAPAVRRLFEDRFARRFDWSWRPRFLENPCEVFAGDAIGNGIGDHSFVPDVAGGGAAGSSSGGLVAAPGTNGRSGPGDVLAFDPGISAQDQVRRAVAEHTGLPAWTVEDSSRMSTDLHLNSITVSEIVTKLASSRGLPPPVDPTTYANASVDEIADALDRLADAGPDDAPDGAAATPGVAGWVREFAVVRIPARPLAAGEPWKPGTWEGFGVASPKARELFGRLESEPFGNGVLVWVDADPGEDQVTAILAGAQRCAERRREAGEPVRLVIVQHGWGAAGFARSFYLEHASLDVLVVNLPPRSDGTDWALREIGNRAEGFREVFVDQSGAREECSWEPLEASPADREVPLGRDDLVVVTGGGKGITAECGFQLAQRTGCALLVLGRSAPDAGSDLAHNLERFRAAGVRVSYQRADVTDAATVDRAVTAGSAELGLAVTGVLHGAGVNRPRTVVDQTVGDLRSTLAPKVTGLRNVLAALHPDRLKLLVTFGSIIARMGLEGEADYALANEWLTQQTEVFQRQHPSCRCRAIEWSAWSGLGMGERLGRIDALRRRGVSAIPIDQGVAEFLTLIETPSGPTSLVVSGRFGEPRTFTYDRPEPAGLRFVDTVLVHYPGIELVAECQLSRESDPYLDDHVLGGERLLPAVMALEALAQTATALLGRDPGTVRVQFRDLAFRSAIVVPTSGEANLSLRVLALAQDDGEVQLAIRCSSTDFQVNHVEARCRVKDRDLPIDSGLPTDRRGEDLSALDPGRSLYGSVLFQRGRFQRIDRYQLIEARRCASRITGGSDAWFAPGLPQSTLLGDAGARDAAVHAIQACIPHRVVIPIAVGSLDTGWLDPSAEHSMVATEVADRGAELVYELAIFDQTGRRVEHWRDLLLRVVGPPTDRRLDSPLLAAPYVERRLAQSRPEARVRVALEFITEQRRLEKGRSDATHRPDGKPDPGGSGFCSVAYSGRWRLGVSADLPVGGDLEAVNHRESESWERLLGRGGLALASVASERGGESLDVSATRVWTAHEALKKTGLAWTAPVLDESQSDGEWVVFRAGNSLVYSSVIGAGAPGTRETDPELCVAVALADG